MSAAVSDAALATTEQRLLEDIVSKVLVSEGAALAVMLDDNSGTLEASNGTDDDANHPTSRDRFRIGSITKVFTAVATLTLVDEGVVDLDVASSAYISRVEVPEGVTVRDLLQHTSGILDAGQLDALFESDDRVWSPEAILD